MSLASILERGTNEPMKAIVTITAALALSASTAEAKTAVELSAALGKPVLLANTKNTNYLKIGVTGFERGDAQRTPVNLSIVLDRSSSMTGEKIEKAKEAALLVLDRLGRDDILSIVTYDSTVNVLVPATKVRDRDQIARVIRQIQPRGSTALFAGVSRGIEEVRKFLDDNRVNRVILLSDGQANVGPSSPNALGRLGASAQKEGIAVTTIGLGLGYNEDLMAQLARKSDGNHAFAENGEKLVQIFGYELGDVLSVVAQELAIVVKLEEGVRPVRILNRDGEIHGQEVVLSLNQLYAKQEKYFLLEVEVAPHAVSEQVAVADVRLSYANMVTGETDRRVARTGVSFSASAKAVSLAENRDVMIAAIESIAVAQNRTAVALRDQGKVKEAEKLLMKNAGWLDENAGRYSSPRLKSYGASNVQDAKSLDGERWNKRRKAMRKSQHELDFQQSY